MAKRPDKVFYKENILPEDLEHLLSTSIESRFANLLYGKLLESGPITLSRKELFLLKRYMMMVSIRMYGPENFSAMMKNFEKNAERYLLLEKHFMPWLSMLKRNRDLDLSNQELYELALRVCCENDNIAFIEKDSRATLEIVAWAKTFVESYLAIWDAPKGMEFVLSDCSMVSEYEGCHQLTGGLDLSKFSYCKYRLSHKSNDYEVFLQAKTLASLQTMYENYNVFNLSSTRCLVAINPFFTQYFGMKITDPKGGEFIANPPDIWPAIVQDKNLFKPPISERVYPGFNSMEDRYVYEPKILKPEDMVYVNSMILSLSNEIIGFNDFASISASISYFLWHKTTMKNGDFLSLESKDDIIKFADDLLYDPMFKLQQMCSEKLGKDQQLPYIQLFDEVFHNTLIDFENNKYIYWYLLSSKDETRRFSQFDFLGNPDERIAFIEEKYHELWGKPFE